MTTTTATTDAPATNPIGSDAVNRDPVSSDPIASNPAGEEYSLELTGWRLHFARLFWIVAAFLNAISFLAGLPRSWSIAVDLSDNSVHALARIGAPAWGPAAYLVLLDTATIVLFFAVAVIIFLRKSTERLAIITSLMLIFTGMLYTAPGYEAMVPMWLITSGAAFAETFEIAFLLLFPTGRYLPGWSWLTLPFLFAWRFWVWGTMYIPWLYASDRTGDNYPFLRQETTDLLLLFAVFLVCIGLQVYRYRRLASHAQRQQAKWLVWSASMAIVMVGLYVIWVNVTPALQHAEGTGVLLRLIGRTLRQAALCLIPLAMMRAILRNRLYDIDFVINRSLVYVPVTSILAGVFAAVAGTAQRFFVATTGQNSDVAVIISTVVVTALFQPVRAAIQGFVDNRMKESPDSFKTLNQLDGEIAAIANAIDREVVLERLLKESVRATGAEGGAVYLLREGTPTLVASTPEWHGPVRLQFPIAHDGIPLGWLVLGMRRGGAAYLTIERERLAQSAMQTGRLVFLLQGLAQSGASRARFDSTLQNATQAELTESALERRYQPTVGVTLPLP